MLRAWAVVVVVLTAPLLYYVRPRLPVSATTRVRRFDLSFVRTSSFWVLQAGNILESLGYFIPGIYLPSYARTLGLSSISGTLTVALFNTTSVFGAIILGTLIDNLHVTTVILISGLGATMSVFLLWGLAVSLPLLCIFSLIYGLFAGGFTTTVSEGIQAILYNCPEYYNSNYHTKVVGDHTRDQGARAWRGGRHDLRISRCGTGHR